MQYRLDPKSGNKLSALGFGCMRFPSTSLGRIDVEASEALVLTAIEQGVNYFDTAYLYRGNEEVVGGIFARNSLRERVFLATKLPHALCHETKDFDAYFVEQLERLQTTYIDYYLIHNISSFDQWENLVKLGIEDWIAHKKQAGSIRQIGFSFHGPAKDFSRLLEAYAWDFCQIQYNYVNETYQAGRAGLELAAKLGLPVFIMEPLLGGKLTAGLPPRALEVFRRGNANATPAEWALRWIWNHPEATMTLSGMNTAAQLSENITVAKSALPHTMSKAELTCIEEVVGIFNESNKVNCTGCNYCMPCPKQINIPGCFTAYNTSFALTWYDGIQQYVLSTGVMSKDAHLASDCINCGACTKHCPQHIDIPEELKRVRRRLQPAFLPPLLRFGAKLYAGKKKE